MRNDILTISPAGTFLGDNVQEWTPYKGTSHVWGPGQEVFTNFHNKSMKNYNLKLKLLIFAKLFKFYRKFAIFLKVLQGF